MKTNLFRLSCYILLLAFTSCSSCKKNEPPKPEDTLPPATQTGAGTFGCLIDGIPYAPIGSQGIGGWIPPARGGYTTQLSQSPTRNNVKFSGNNEGARFQIYVRSVSKPGTYPLNFDTNPGYLYPENYAVFYKNVQIDRYGTTRLDTYVTTSQVTGSVTFTRADTVNNIVSGTFEFKAKNLVDGKIISVSGGRFDL